MLFLDKFYSLKARLWPEGVDHEAVSPEFFATAKLHVFAVRRSGLKIDSKILSDEQVLSAVADQSERPLGYAIISLHPVQAKLFLADPRVQSLLRDMEIKDLGLTGFQAYPTASLRTMFVRDHDYFIKASLNVRITNCVRKNSWYELESAIIIDSLLSHLAEAEPKSVGYLQPVSEPAAVSWYPRGVPEADQNWFKDQTGAILRSNFCIDEGEDNCLMAGTLFAKDLHFVPNIKGFLTEQLCGRVGEEEILNWFASYQALLLKPVLSLFFNHGIVLEPHLQNTVVVHSAGNIQKLLLRDYEGVKLTSEMGAQWLDESIHPRVKQSLCYPRAQGWSRISYCLFVNNLSEAILALSYGSPKLALPMWQLVKQQLQDIRSDISQPAPELDALINGEDIFCKTNFKVRLAAEADKQAGYVKLACPWKEG